MEKEKDIINDAYYLVNIFKEKKQLVTQLHIQKLMFLFEAYYMNVKNAPCLYECDFKAWNFGPVAPQLYNKFKKYGANQIELTQEQIEEGNNISNEKKELMEQLYEAFKDFSARDLVNFTHAEGSPWKEAWDEKEYSVISKEKMKNWFSKYVKEN
ncbi:MAG: DUF4065 domain-containing protein [Clostridia bacterium]|nr:DUF4065 domain-containing protein [Clostridia bacterium]